MIEELEENSNKSLADNEIATTSATESCPASSMKI